MKRTENPPARDLKKIATWTTLGLLLLIAGLLGTLHSVAVSGIPKTGTEADQYLAMYLLTQEAKVDQSTGRHAVATWKLYKARWAIRAFKEDHPHWQTGVTDYRKKETDKQFWQSVKDLAVPWR